MTSTVLKLFGTRQITIPKEWRDFLDTQFFKASMQNDKIILEPILDANQEDDFDIELDESLKAKINTTLDDYKKGKFTIYNSLSDLLN